MLCAKELYQLLYHDMTVSSNLIFELNVEPLPKLYTNFSNILLK